MLTLNIHDLAVRCVIGCNPDERHRLQPLSLDLSLRFDARAAALHDDPALTWDYSALAARLRFVLVEGRFHLIEAAAWTALLAVLSPQAPGDPRPPLQEGRLRLTKPGAFPGQAQASALVELSAPSTQALHVEWGTLWKLQGEGSARLSQLRVLPGGLVPLEPQPGRRLVLLPLGPGLRLDGEALPPRRTRRLHGPGALEAEAEALALLLAAPEGEGSFP
ncbi:MAG: dihydroneopterin aldolase [Alphaproteobacteria bacterium]|nr:dihydroneopterin aldolase [Alphaproteobacteria bacterium]